MRAETQMLDRGGFLFPKVLCGVCSYEFVLQFVLCCQYSTRIIFLVPVRIEVDLKVFERVA